MTSIEVGFFAQLKGKLTKKRYKCATVFVDHFSRLQFIHLQLDDKSNETLTAKLIIFGIIFCLALQQVDFVMAYPQAPIEMDIYMELPQRIQTKHENSKEHVLKLEKNIYGQKQAGRVWNSFLMDKLMSIGFTTSLIDDCVFFRGDVIFMVYVDNGIFLGSEDSQMGK
jgi:hypothetical protein